MSIAAEKQSPGCSKTLVDAVASEAVAFRVLGSFEVWRADAEVAFGGGRERSLLALLAARPGQTVLTIG
jgi:hypothetical protein